MRSSTKFLPGTIWWLPAQNDIPDFDPQHVHKSVPKKCFNHPVLVLAEDQPNKFVTLLILTSFHNSDNISTRVQRRGHELKYYVPIHPAHELVSGPPTLHLAASQETVRHVWANVQPYRCPSSWLQPTWSVVWKKKPPVGKVESASLRALALYGIREGYEPGVYKKVLESCVEKAVVPVTTPEQRLGAVRAHDLERNRAVPVPDITPRSHLVDSTFPRAQLGPVRSYSWGGRALDEREPLLPKTHRSAPRVSWVGRMDGGSGASPSGRGSFFVVCVFCVLVVLVFLVAVGGVLWTGYVVLGSLFTAFRDSVVAVMGPLKGRIVGFVSEAGRALRDAGTQVRAFWEGLVNWVKAL